MNLHLQNNGNCGIAPHKRPKWGTVRNYAPAILEDSFAFYGKDINEERYEFYMKELRRIERRKNRG